MSDKKDNVEPITKKVKPKKSKPSKPVGMTADDWTPTAIQNDIMNLVAEYYEADYLEDWAPSVFKSFRKMRYREKDADSIVRVNSKREIEHVPLHDYIAEMREFFRYLFRERYLGSAMTIAMQDATAKAIVKYLTQLSSDDVQIFAFADEQFLCWHKLHFGLTKLKILERVRDLCILDDDFQSSDISISQWKHYLEEIERYAPNWHSVIMRCGNARAFVAFLGSLLDREMRSAQFVIMWGAGGDSKGSMLDAIARVFSKKLVHQENIPEKHSGALRFFNASLEGKRLLICPDIGPENIFTSHFKQLTGDDTLTLEGKGEPARNVKNHLKIIQASNWQPNVPKDPYARRRIILVPIERFHGPKDPDFSTRLYEEADMFFPLAYLVYMSMPNKVEFEQDEEVYRKNFEEVNDDLLDLIEEYFFVATHEELSAYRKAGLAKCDYPYIKSADFLKYCNHFFPKINTNKIKELMKEKYHILMKTENIKDENGEQGKVYIGLEMKQPMVIYNLLKGSSDQWLQRSMKTQLKRKIAEKTP